MEDSAAQDIADDISNPADEPESDERDSIPNDSDEASDVVIMDFDNMLDYDTHGRYRGLVATSTRSDETDDLKSLKDAISKLDNLLEKFKDSDNGMTK